MTTASPPLGPDDLQATLGLEDVHVWIASLEQDEAEIAPCGPCSTSPSASVPIATRLRRAAGNSRSRADCSESCSAATWGSSRRAFSSRYNTHGKPLLGELHAPTRVRFNISHSGELALFGFANDRELGIDLETIRPDFAADAIAARFFAPAELHGPSFVAA